MAHQDCTVRQRIELFRQRGLPGLIAGLFLAGHSRIADSIAVSELMLEARDQLVVPAIMRAFAGALNEEDLPGHRRTPPLSVQELERAASPRDQSTWPQPWQAEVDAAPIRCGCRCAPLCTDYTERPTQASQRGGSKQ